VQPRTLLYIPIIHAQQDMGGLQESVRRLKTATVGRRGWERHADLVARRWEEIAQGLQRRNLCYPNVRVYQDGLPVCGREAEIVTKLAKTGSPNHRILVELMERGAHVMGTESSELLVEEYQLIQQAVAAADAGEAARIERRQKALSDSLLQKRDQFIARRINETLQPGEVGILFVGMLHAVANRLDSDIRVIYPMERPLSRGRRR
jgi:hypothetical protein